MQLFSEVLEELEALAEVKYKKFNQKIVPTKQKMLGVRLPNLRKIAKKIVKQNPYEFLALDKKNIYEMVFLEGLVLSYMKENFITLVPLLESFLKKVDNWSQVDSTFSGFKSIKMQQVEVLEVIKEWLNSEDEFIVRSALVILLFYYVEDKYLKMIFDITQNVKHRGYYVKMANAWLLSVCMMKFPNQTITFFKSNNLDKITFQKAIAKSLDSYQIAAEYKKELKRVYSVTKPKN